MKHSLFIMGGSSIYLPLFFTALDRHEMFNHFERITLFGRNKAKLSYLTRFGQALLSKNKPACRIDSTTRFEDCLQAQYSIVFNQIRFGGLESRCLDEQTAVAQHLFADETLGIVGVSNAIRTITGLAPFINQLYCKKGDFLFLNFTNPCSIVCQFIINQSAIKTIGICDYPEFYKNRLADFLDLEKEKTRLDYFGLNHFALISDIWCQNQSYFQAFKTRQKDFELYFDVQDHFEPLLIPAWEHVFARPRILSRQKKEQSRAAFLLDIEKEFQNKIKTGQLADDKVSSLLQKRNCNWYEEGVIPFLKTYLGLTPSRQVIVNVDARDIFELGRPHCIVETNTVFQDQQPVCQAPLSSLKKSALFPYLVLAKKAEFLLLEGILEKDPQKIIGSCLINPLIQNIDQVIDYFTALKEKDRLINEFFQSIKLR